MCMWRPPGEDLAKSMPTCKRSSDQTELPENMTVTVRGSVEAMRSSFQSFGLGLILSTLLVYLILVAQFQSFVDPFLILLAMPTGLTGVLLIFWSHRHHAERHVADGGDHDGGHRRLQQHPDRRIHQPVARRGPPVAGGGRRWPAASACGPC